MISIFILSANRPNDKFATFCWILFKVNTSTFYYSRTFANDSTQFIFRNKQRWLWIQAMCVWSCEAWPFRDDDDIHFAQIRWINRTWRDFICINCVDSFDPNVWWGNERIDIQSIYKKKLQTIWFDCCHFEHSRHLLMIEFNNNSIRVFLYHVMSTAEGKWNSLRPFRTYALNELNFSKSHETKRLHTTRISLRRNCFQRQRIA